MLCIIDSNNMNSRTKVVQCSLPFFPIENRPTVCTDKYNPICDKCLYDKKIGSIQYHQGK